MQTNFVQLDATRIGLTGDAALELMRAAGVALSPTIHPGVLRAVTHLDVDDDDIAQAADAVPGALRAHAGV